MNQTIPKTPTVGEPLNQIRKGETVFIDKPIDLRTAPVEDEVNHPSYYGGKDNPYEAIKVVEAWNLGTHLDTAVIYLSRAGKKDNNPVRDLKKAIWWIERRIAQLEGGKGESDPGPFTREQARDAMAASDSTHPVDQLCDEITGLEEPPEDFFTRASRELAAAASAASMDNPLAGDPVVLRHPVTDRENRQKEFVTAFHCLAAYAYQNAWEKGFWDRREAIKRACNWTAQTVASGKLTTQQMEQAAQDAIDMQFVALVQSELGEVTEGIRHGHKPDEHLPQFSSTEVELADAIIRIMEYAEGRQWLVAEALIAKMEYNAGRPHMHGGKTC